MPSDSNARTKEFYDALAGHFHLIFEDWDGSMRRQGQIVSRLLPLSRSGPILDVACGIGTQSLPLAALDTRLRAQTYRPRRLLRLSENARLAGFIASSASMTCARCDRTNVQLLRGSAKST
jgi:hypothetical protein